MLRIEAPNFVAGVVLENERVVETAPILRYMLGWTAARVAMFGYKRGWEVSES